MQRKMFYFLFFVLFLPSLMLAQGMLRGKVTDLQSGEPLIGANVIVEGTQTGAASDVNGEFVLRNLNPGVYSVKASFIGYQSITVSNLRVNNQLTTEVDFQLPAEGVTVGTVEIVAEKPLVQKDNTNKIRSTTSEDIEALPVRGVNSIVSLNAGVVAYRGDLYIRGGRSDEVGYYLEGVSITNPMAGGRAVTLSQDAIEEIQVQSGGYTAEFGNANAGIVKTSLKSGGNQFKGSVEYITDNIGFSSKDKAYNGEKRLGTYWYGYDEMSVVMSGPIFDQRFKFFTNFNYIYNRDVNRSSYPGVNAGWVKGGSGDSVNLVMPAGARPEEQSSSYTGVMTLNADFNPLLLRLTGTYTFSREDEGGSGLTEIMNNRVGLLDGQNGAFNLKATHIVNPDIYYEVGAGYFLQTAERYDRYLKDDYWAYGDSAANANVGYTWPTSNAPNPLNVMGFTFIAPGDLPVNYLKYNRQGLNFNGALSILIGKVHSIKVGAEFQQYVLRNWSVGNQTSLYSSLETIMRPDLNVDSAKRSILRSFGVNNFGYDELGNEVEDGLYGPRKPVFLAAFVQDKIEYEDIIFNMGLRFDYFDLNSKMLKDPSLPDLGVNFDTGELLEAGWVDVPTFSAVSPRLGFSFPVSDQTVFHAQWGKFVQQPELQNVYRGYSRYIYETRANFFFGDPGGLNLRPTRTTQYEIGFSQQLSDFMSFDVTGYYRDVKDQVVFKQQKVSVNSAVASYTTLANGDFATTKGFELSLTMRRYNRLAANASLSFQDAQGTGSFPNSNRGIVGSPLDGSTIFEPQYVSPLDFNNSVKANANLDYRFGENDGPAFLHEFGASVLFYYNTGHPFTRALGNAREVGVSGDLTADARTRQAAEPLNASLTPSNFTVDLRIDKTIRLYDRLKANIYIQVLNLFDNQNVQDVFLKTGSAEDDGFLGNPEESQKLKDQYGSKYEEVYKAMQIDYADLYGPARQIRLGLRLEY